MFSPGNRTRRRAAAANLALVATATTSFVSGHETIHALNSGFDPENSNDKRHGAYGNWPQKGTQWVEYTWSQPIHTGKIDVYWFDDHNGVRLPKACRLKYFDGKQFVPVKQRQGFGPARKTHYNTTTFDDVHTTKLRLEMDSSGESTGILQWRVYDWGDSPDFPPVVVAGLDRAVVLPGKTWLSGSVRGAGKPDGKLAHDLEQTIRAGRCRFRERRLRRNDGRLLRARRLRAEAHGRRRAASRRRHAARPRRPAAAGRSPPAGRHDALHGHQPVAPRAAQADHHPLDPALL